MNNKPKPRIQCGVVVRMTVLQLNATASKNRVTGYGLEVKKGNCQAISQTPTVVFVASTCIYSLVVNTVAYIDCNAARKA